MKNLLSLAIVLTLPLAATAWDFTKDAFFSWSSDKTATFTDQGRGTKSRTLTLKSSGSCPNATLYSYTPAKAETDYRLTFTLKSALQGKVNLDAGVTMMDAKGHKVPNGEMRFPLTIGSDGRVSCDVSFKSVPGTERIRVMPIALRKTEGEVTIESMSFAEGTLPKRAGAELFKFEKSFWSNWPRNDSLKLVKGKNQVTFTVTSAGERPTLYTYFDTQSALRARLSFKLNYVITSRLSKGGAQIRLDCLKQDGKAANFPSVTLPLELPEGADKGELAITREFDIPAQVPRMRFTALALNGLAGEFTISDVHIQEIYDEAAVRKASSPIVIDGIIQEKTWQDADALCNFYSYNVGTPDESPTMVQMSYDDKALYIAVQCPEKPEIPLKPVQTQRDSAIWGDDSMEFFFAGRPGHAFQLIVNRAGAQFDAELRQRVPGDPWRPYAEWNATWQSAAAALPGGGWSAEIAIPLEMLGGAPKSGETWRFNLVRNRRSSGHGVSQWTPTRGEMHNVTRFSTLAFSDTGAVVTRGRDMGDAETLAIPRKKKEFANLPRREGAYSVGGGSGCYLLANYSKGFQEKNRAQWPERQKKMLAELLDALGCTPVGYPWCVGYFGGKEANLKLLRDNNARTDVCVHNSSHDRTAIANGTAAYVSGRFVNAADPALHKITMDWLIKNLEDAKWILPYVASFRGTDEPTNNLHASFSHTRNKEHRDALEKLSKEIKATHGFGKYGVYDHYAMPSSPTAPFERIAFYRWWNERVAAHKAEELEHIRKAAPHALYIPITINTVGTYSGIEDIPLFATVGDVISVDPYPTATLAEQGRARALYHTGFSSKLAHDLAPSARTRSYIQAFRYRGLAPSKEEMREWTSQALKSGATIITWYTDGALENAPGIYEEMLRLSKLIRGMKPLALPNPADARTGILYSYVDSWAKGDQAQNEAYSLYVVLGEKLHRDFRFVPDTALDRKAASLDGINLLIVPGAQYLSKATANALRDFVSKGGTLLLLDSKAFQYHDDGTSAQAVRNELLGNAAFKNGARRKFGRGEVICMEDNSLTSPRQAVTSNPPALFLELLKKAGSTNENPIWDFTIPDK